MNDSKSLPLTTHRRSTLPDSPESEPSHPGLPLKNRFGPLSATLYPSSLTSGPQTEAAPPPPPHPGCRSWTPRALLWVFTTFDKARDSLRCLRGLSKLHKQTFHVWCSSAHFHVVSGGFDPKERSAAEGYAVCQRRTNPLLRLVIDPATGTADWCYSFWKQFKC